MGGGDGDGGGALRSGLQDNCFSQILGNNAEQGYVSHCLQGSRVSEN
jgi:hypothetical protein